MSDLFDLLGPRVYVVSDTVFKDYEERIKKKKVARLDEQIKYYEECVGELKKKREELV
jgi:hypothetical protein